MLADLVTEELQRMLGKSVHDGYQLTQQLKRAHDVFNFPIGEELLPWVRRIAVDYCAIKNSASVQGLCVEMPLNKSLNYHHLVLRHGERLVITLSHLPDGQVMPRGAHFREDLSKINPTQIQLLFPDNPEKDFGNKKIYAILTHVGKSSPEVIYLKVKHPDKNAELTKMSIPLYKPHDDSETNIISDPTPEFLEYLKKASNSNRKS